MTVATEQFIEFRCSHCFQVRHEPVNVAGSDVDCPFCCQAMLVPEATADRLRDMEQVELTCRERNVEPGMFVAQRMSPSEREGLAKQRATKKTMQPGRDGTIDVGVMSCGRASRIAAYVVDGLIGMLAVGASLYVGYLLSEAEICQSFEAVFARERRPELFDLACYFGIVFFFQLIVWTMIATLGQSPGKMLLGIKIVDSRGKCPGFLKGVILRYVIAGLLMNIIPLGTIANYVAFFWKEPPRCLHDHLAGTWVVDC